MALLCVFNYEMEKGLSLAYPALDTQIMYITSKELLVRGLLYTGLKMKMMK